MKQLLFSLAIVPAVLAFAGIVKAQDGDRMQPPADELVIDENVAQSESMWFYLHELRRYDDPQVAIRRKEELKGKQRRQRLAAMKWFGYSPARPMANPTPSTGYYSPMWAGNAGDAYRWIGNAYVTTAVRIETTAEKEIIER